MREGDRAVGGARRSRRSALSPGHAAIARERGRDRVWPARPVARHTHHGHAMPRETLANWRDDLVQLFCKRHHCPEGGDAPNSAANAERDTSITGQPCRRESRDIGASEAILVYDDPGLYVPAFRQFSRRAKIMEGECRRFRDENHIIGTLDRMRGRTRDSRRAIPYLDHFVTGGCSTFCRLDDSGGSYVAYLHPPFKNVKFSHHKRGSAADGRFYFIQRRRGTNRDAAPAAFAQLSAYRNNAAKNYNAPNRQDMHRVRNRTEFLEKEGLEHRLLASSISLAFGT